MRCWLLIFNACLFIGVTREISPKDHFDPATDDACWRDYEKHAPIAYVDQDGERINIDVDDEIGTINNLTANYITDVKFLLFTRLKKRQRIYLNNKASIEKSTFNTSKNTKFIIHGWRTDRKSEMVHSIKKAFIKHYDYNVIVVDWGKLAKTIMYGWVVAHIPGVGDYVGQFIHFLVSKLSVNAKSVHLIGHSAGAHVSGYAGKRVQKHGYKISRITGEMLIKFQGEEERVKTCMVMSTGLDPASVGFGCRDPTTRLDSSDADYVDCIHTSNGMLGLRCPTCHSDFYANSGGYQPGCKILIVFDYDVCRHSRAWMYFKSSINPRIVFRGRACSKVSCGNPYNCDTKNTAVMGYRPRDRRFKGIYHVMLTEKPPYTHWRWRQPKSEPNFTRLTTH